MFFRSKDIFELFLNREYPLLATNFKIYISGNSLPKAYGKFSISFCDFDCGLNQMKILNVY